MTALEFIRDLLIATFSQLAALFAGVFIFGLLIHLFSNMTFKSLQKAFGTGGVYFVAWLGTPVHELGHALFCLIFFHKILAIKFFQPDPVTGTLGYVTHTWNRKNPWHILGNFFIGVGPVLLGCAALLAVFYILVPDSSRTWDSIVSGTSQLNSGSTFGDYLNVFKDASLAMTQNIFTTDNLTHWRFWLFLYLAICVSSNIKLSWEDMKLAFSGLLFIAGLLLVANLVAMFIGHGGEDLLPFTASTLGITYSLFILALILSITGFVIIYLVTALYVKLRHGYLLNPF